MVYLVYLVHCPIGPLGSSTPLAAGLGSTASFPVKGCVVQPLTGDPWPLCCEGLAARGVVKRVKNTACSRLLLEHLTYEPD
jgi:hypothetical protein